MARLLTLAFFGEPRDAHAFEHAHESPRTMTIPLIILAAGALLAVGLGWPTAFGGSFRIEHVLESSLTFGQMHAHEAHHSTVNPLLLATLSTTLAMVFAALGYTTYRGGLALAEQRAAKLPVLHRIVLNKYYVDEAVEAAILAPLRALGNGLWKFFDVIIIDGLLVNAPGSLTLMAGDVAALFQTGRVRNYVLCMVLGALVLLGIFLR